MSAKLNAALDAARRGFNVFPIRPYVHPGEGATPEQLEAAAKDAKAPLIANWQNLATQDPTQIEQWWAQWPDANLATTTNMLIVPDVDPRNGGKPTFEMLAMVEDWPKTAVSNTQGGGNHIFYAAPEGRPVKGGTHKLGQGVDIKARGGYVLLPGSTIEGRAYTWANENPIALAPAWIVAKCDAAREKTDSAGKRLLEEDDTARELFANWIRDHAPRAELGEIDDKTFKVAARGYDFGCSQETVHELTLEWNDTHCDSLGDTERLSVIVESAGRNRENAIGSSHPLAPGFEAVEIDERKVPPAVTPNLPKPRLFVIRADEASRIALDRRGEPLIQGVIDRGTMSVLVGKGGGGKTFLALDWAYHVAKGLEWAGKRVKQGPVVYLAAEAGNMILSRLRALEQHYGPLQDAPLYVIPCPANFSRGPEDIKAILALIRDVEIACGQKVELFVVDTLARVMTGDENSAKDMGVVIESVDFIRQQVGCHGMLIHHPNKAGTSARGSGNVFGGTDTEMWAEDKVLSFTKQRDMPLGSDIRFALDPIRIGQDADGAPVTSCVVRVVVRGEAEEAMPLTPQMRDVWDLLSAALDDAERTTFDMAFLKKIPFGSTADTSPARTTLILWMSKLSESGYIKKRNSGQWVVSGVRSVRSVSDSGEDVSADIPMPLGRGSDTSADRPKLKTRKRAG